MRTLVLIVPFLLLMACQNFGWQGRKPAREATGEPSIEQLVASYESEAFWASVRRRKDGLVNAFGRDLDKIIAFGDRHLFNYSKDDPYINFPTNQNRWDKLFRTYVDAFQWLPSLPWSGTQPGVIVP